MTQRLAELRKFLSSDSTFSKDNSQNHKLKSSPIFQNAPKYKSLRLMNNSNIKSPKRKSIWASKRLPKLGHQRLLYPYGLLIRMLISVAAVMAIVASRWSFQWRTIAPRLELALFAIKSVELYILTLSVNIAMVEMVVSDGQNLINYNSINEYYEHSSQRFRKSVIDVYDEILENGVSENSKFIYGLLHESVCDVLNQADFDKRGYPACDIAIAGQATKPLITFLKQYLNLVDKFFIEWTLIRSREERVALLIKDEYSSLIAYATHDQYGTADALYYHMILPIYTRLSEGLESKTSSLRLCNIVSFMLLLAISIYPIFNAPGDYTSPPPLHQMPKSLTNKGWFIKY
jgi:hypothetical protein